MAEEKPSLHIDTDWKKQAQEEKKKLAEQEEKRRASAPPPAAGVGVGGGAVPVGAGPGPGASVGPTAGARVGARAGGREMPEASFATMVQSIVTQVLFYLGDLAPRGGEPTLNLDMAKHHIDTLGVLEEKTKGNLSEEEQRMLDAALYESRMRYVAVASQFTGP
jgi:hypothetical protein